MLVLVMCFSSIFMTFDIDGDAAWTNPEYRITETWRVNPYEYVTDEIYPRGNVCNVDDEEAPGMQITLVDYEKAVLISQNGLEAEVGFDFSTEHLWFSPNGEFILLYNYRTEDCIRIDLLNGTTNEFRPFDDERVGGTGYRFLSPLLSNTGSVAYKCHQTFRMLDSDLNVVVSDNDHFRYNTCASMSDDGSTFYITNGDHIEAYDSERNIIWSREIEEFPQELGMTTIYTSSSGSVVCVVMDIAGKILFLDGETGAEISQISPERPFGRTVQLTDNCKYIAYSYFANSITGNNGFATIYAGLLTDCLSDLYQINEYSIESDLSDGWVLRLLALADNGVQMYMLAKAGRYIKYLLFSPTAELIYCTEWNETPRSFKNYNIISYLRNDGEEFCYFNGDEIIFYSIQELP